MPKRLDYQQWLTYCFDRPVSGPIWYWEHDPSSESYDWYEPGADEVAHNLAQLFENCQELPDQFSLQQIGLALQYILGQGSGYMSQLLHEVSNAELQIAAVEAMHYLYTDLFTPHCTHYYGHLDAGPESPSPLNGVCYMFWDMDGLEAAAMFPGHEHLVEPIFAVLDSALSGSNPACFESALHGLGHLQQYQPDKVAALLEKFRRTNPEITPELRSYAAAAATGCVQ